MTAPLLIVLALASSIPTIDLQKSCHGAEAGALPEDRATAYQSCLHDEEAAREQLRREWGKVPARDRASCVDQATGFSPSYVELLTCLEMAIGGNFSVGASSLQAPLTGGSPPLNPSQLGTPGAPGTPGTPGATAPGGLGSPTNPAVPNPGASAGATAPPAPTTPAPIPPAMPGAGAGAPGSPGAGTGGAGTTGATGVGK